MKRLQLRTSCVACWILLSVLWAFGLSACGGPVEPKLPPPEYVEPQLPPWQPEADTRDDSLDAALAGGEWVADTPEGLGGAPP